MDTSLSSEFEVALLVTSSSIIRELSRCFLGADVCETRPDPAVLSKLLTEYLVHTKNDDLNTLGAAIFELRKARNACAHASLPKSSIVSIASTAINTTLEILPKIEDPLIPETIIMTCFQMRGVLQVSALELKKCKKSPLASSGSLNTSKSQCAVCGVKHIKIEHTSDISFNLKDLKKLAETDKYSLLKKPMVILTGKYAGCTAMIEYPNGSSVLVKFPNEKTAYVGNANHVVFLDKLLKI